MIVKEQLKQARVDLVRASNRAINVVTRKQRFRFVCFSGSLFYFTFLSFGFSVKFKFAKLNSRQDASGGPF